jgi:Transposase DDE domain
MGHSTARKRARQIALLRTQFAQADGLAFADVLPAARIETALRATGAGWRDCVYTPVLTLWAFLGQVVSPDGSCRAAVARVLAWLVSRGEPPCTPRTSPYCKARAKLPESLFVRLTRETGGALHRAAPDGWRWHGRRVKLVDGTTVTMPDTEENQKEYPQQTAQQPGLGFPIARLVVVFCLGCGAVLDAAMGRYQGKKTGENTLLRALEGFEPRDVLLADRYFSGYFDLAHWLQRGVDLVTLLHQRRRCDLRRGRRLGPGDHVVLWTKPERPSWMDAATYADVPQTLAVREVRIRVAVPGFRTKVLEVVTTLLDAAAYPARDLAALYRARWHAELDLRTLKITLGMDVLRCKTPEMVRKEIWAHLLAYNLIRRLMAEAAGELGCTPRDLSFKGTLQTLTEFADRLLHARGKTRKELYEWLLIAIAAHQVNDRPGRVEPRARKRRRKQYPRLMQPRRVAKRRLGVEC